MVIYLAANIHNVCIVTSEDTVLQMGTMSVMRRLHIFFLVLVCVGGDFAFGPGFVMYFLPFSTLSNKVFAQKDGEYYILLRCTTLYFYYIMIIL